MMQERVLLPTVLNRRLFSRMNATFNERFNTACSIVVTTAVAWVEL
jgi:hypothetical protein